MAPNGAKAATYKGVRRFGQVSGPGRGKLAQVFGTSAEITVGQGRGKPRRGRPTGHRTGQLDPPGSLCCLSPPYRDDGGDYQCPVFFIEAQGSWGGNASPFCSSSIECLSGERTKAMTPSRGGRLMVTPAFISRAQVS